MIALALYLERPTAVGVTGENRVRFCGRMGLRRNGRTSAHRHIGGCEWRDGSALPGSQSETRRLHLDRKFDRGEASRLE
jgi:hypothetical protein